MDSGVDAQIIPKKFRLKTVCGDINTPYMYKPLGLSYVSNTSTILVANSLQHTIVKCDLSTGVISHVAGTYGISGFTDNQTPLQSALNTPSDVWAVQEDIYYIADGMNNRIRMVAGGVMTTIIGDGSAASSVNMITPTMTWYPKNLFLKDNSLYYSEYEKVRVMSYMLPTNIGTVAGYSLGSTIGMTAQTSQVNMPQGLYLYNDYRLLVADTGNHRILRVDTTFTLSIIAGTGSSGYSNGIATSSQLSSPAGVVAYNNSILITDKGNNCIRRLNTDGTLTTIAGVCTVSGYNGDQSVATDGYLSGPSGIINVNGVIYFTDSGNGLVRKLEPYCDVGYTDYDENQCIISTSSPACYGISAADSSVCSGKGYCYSYNYCACISGYYGAQCNYAYNCGGISPDTAGVCNSNGVCKSQDQCNCYTGYVGNLCGSKANCYGIEYGNSSACGGNGVCVKNNGCSCGSGYFGLQCSYSYACNGTAPDSLNVCNGRGACLSGGTCACNAGYYGTYCEKVTSPTSIPSISKVGSTAVTVVTSSTTTIIIVVSVVGGVTLLGLIIGAIALFIILYVKLKKRKPEGTKEGDKNIPMKQVKDEQALKASQELKSQEVINSGELITLTVTNSNTSEPPSSGTIDSYTNYISSAHQMTDSSLTNYLNQTQENSFVSPPKSFKSSSNSMDTFSSKDHTYKIIKILGRGGFGTCYLCADIESNDLIAVKALPANDDNYLSICSEFSKCLAFQHPNLVKSYEYLQGTDRKMVCLAMKYYKNGDLDHVFRNLAKRKPPSDLMLINIINQIGEGLDYLHQVQKVIHRDIKANNIMVDDFDEDNSKITCAIGDFGVSKQANVAHTLTGTVYYSSPELFLGKTTSFSTDIYSFGVTMYLIICNKFNCMAQSSITQQIFSEGEETVYTRIKQEIQDTGVKDEIVELVMRMLAKEPENRPLAKELAQFLKNFTC